jgi:hypothetical protein
VKVEAGPVLCEAVEQVASLDSVEALASEYVWALGWESA